MDLHKIIIGLLIILIVLVLYKRQENAGNTANTAGGLNNFSAEALANIAKVYADTRQTAAFNNITVTSAINTKNINVSGETSLNGNTTLGGNINGKKFSYVNETGNINTTGNITTGSLSVNGNTTITPDGNIGIAGNVTANQILGNEIKVKGNPLANCNWEGQKVVCGDCTGAGDDLYLTCINGYITNLWFGDKRP